MREKIKHFETVHEFLDYSVNAKPDNTWDNFTRSSHKDRHSADSHGTKTFSEAVTLAETGWPEGLEKVTKKLDLLLSTGKSKMRINDVAGDFPNIGRFLAGQPDSMSRRIVAQGMKKPIIDIVFAASFSGSIDGERIMNYGAAIAAVIDELENTGFSVGLQLCSITTSGGGVGPVINLKKPGEAMELDRLVYFTANPSFLRRLVFSYWEATLSYSELGYGYGRPANLPETHRPEGAVYFPANSTGEAMDRACGTLEGARTYVKKIIKQQRPDLFPDEVEAA